jgi:hypothetical protein
MENFILFYLFWICFAACSIMVWLDPCFRCVLFQFVMRKVLAPEFSRSRWYTYFIYAMLMGLRMIMHMTDSSRSAQVCFIAIYEHMFSSPVVIPYEVATNLANLSNTNIPWTWKFIHVDFTRKLLNFPMYSLVRFHKYLFYKKGRFTSSQYHIDWSTQP